ncbi:hypothetical protein EHS25_001640 [Saitozyma podzolica]|uniref:Uncharacterized protein n=1 Tax=Saitozyma podzolica TaxID=1890683 RepID=A0A427YGR4_9TREE|nr:hypothetical protein EHS25_001640 [Saitozyma podzolica]
MKISGKTFIVTGGTGGLASDAARMLLAEGASVGLFDVVPTETGDAFAQSLSGEGKAIYVKVDITDSAAVKVAVRLVSDKLHNLAGCVHCAGISLKRPLSNVVAESIGNFEKMLKVNTVGTFIVNAQVADEINRPLNFPDGSDKPGPFWTSDEERGVIVNLASAASRPYARTLAYGPTKAAVVGITEAMADFLGPSGIRVASISPSIIMSPLNAGLGGFFTDDLLKHAIFPRAPIGSEQISSTIKWIIETGAINATNIFVDGGWKMVVTKPGIEGGKDPRESWPGVE